jgi:hypothetical protein
MASRDPLAFQVAEEAVKDWMALYPEIAELCGQSDHGATRPARMLIEAFASARAVRLALDAGEVSGEAILNEHYGIAQEQARKGVTKEWVVGFAQIRCIATGYMLAMLGNAEVAEDFKSRFWAAPFSGSREANES